MSILRIKPALILDLGNHIELSFQLIPAGSFRMGSRGYYHCEEPRHLVQITQPFYLGTFPVTRQQFAMWKPEHGNVFANSPLHPAESMDWHEATQYCSWLTSNFGDQMPANHQAGLPTEAQWEHACRAGTETEFYTGDGEAALAEAGWYDGNSKSKTHPVGLLEANLLGLHDMHGNVWEWCSDAWDAHAYKKRVNGVCDPFVDGKKDANCVVRGGGWGNSPGNCRSAFRGWGRPGNRGRDQGFRVCLFLGPYPGQAERAEQANAGMATRQPRRSEIAQRANFWTILKMLNSPLNRDLSLCNTRSFSIHCRPIRTYPRLMPPEDET